MKRFQVTISAFSGDTLVDAELSRPQFYSLMVSGAQSEASLEYVSELTKTRQGCHIEGDQIIRWRQLR